MTRIGLLSLFLSVSWFSAAAQDGGRSLLRGMEAVQEVSATASSGVTPLWLNANRYGLSSLSSAYGYLRTSVEREQGRDSLHRWAAGYGLDIVAGLKMESPVFVQQAYITLRYGHGLLTVGQRQQPMAFNDAGLSTGALTLGRNARPVPEVRLAVDQWWPVPLTAGWLSFRGHVAFGRPTDDNWQRDFAAPEARRTEGALLHTKAGYVRIGDSRRHGHFSVDLGLEMAAQFGGTSYNVLPREGDGGGLTSITFPSNLKAYWQAFVPSGSDLTERDYQNISGNQLGSWLVRLNADYPGFLLQVYGERFFEDQSAMFFVDYDGYGSGQQWREEQRSHYLFYDIKDMMLGAQLRLKSRAAVDNIVVEYLYTKYQSGPIYHDHTASIPDHIGGQDDYYNHYFYTGWQHHGQVMGNPLFTSPLYNSDGRIQVENNRFWAVHLGFGGSPAPSLGYRLLLTYERGFGTYAAPYPDPRSTTSLLAEATYSPAPHGSTGRWTIKAAIGLDSGRLLGHNFGGQLTLTHRLRVKD